MTSKKALGYGFFCLLGIGLTGCKPSVTNAAPAKPSVQLARSSVAPGTIVIEPQFADAGAFHDGLAMVEVGSTSEAMTGYIDPQGVFRINPKYEFAMAFSDGLAAVRFTHGEQSSFGFIDTAGRIVIEPQFAGTEKFEEGTAIVTIGEAFVGQHGLINKAGKFVINPQYDWLWRVGKDRFAYRTGNSSQLKGILDGQGRVIATPQFVSLVSAGDGLLAATIGKDEAARCGYVDENGKFVINPQFLSCRSFGEGLAAVLFEDGGKRAWGYIDRSGRMVLKTPYGIVRKFNDGLAAVAVGTSEKDAKWGFINKRGEMVIAPQFDEASSFEDARAVVRVGGGFGDQGSSELIAAQNGSAPIAGKWGAIDTSGKYVVNPRFDQMHVGTGRLAPVRVGDHKTGKWGFVQL